MPTTPRRALRSLLALAALAVSLATPARAAIETTADTARVALPAPAFAFTGGSNTVFLWLRREPATGDRAVLDIPGALTITASADGDISAVAKSAAATPPTLTLTLNDALPANEWALLTFSVDAAQNRLLLSVESESLGPRDAALNLAQPFTLGPVSGDLTLGAINALPSFRGVFGLLVVRDHAVSTDDARELFSLRRHFGPYNLDNLAQSGAMTGPAGARWMVNHAMFSQPFNYSGTSYNSLQLASAPDRPARVSDYAVYDASSPLRPDSFRAVRAVHALDSLLYRSPFDVQPGFFVRDLPQTEDPLPPNPVAGVAANLRRLAEHSPPASGAPLRVVASANSRGVKAQDGLGSPANFAHGFTLALLPDVSGIVLRPARTSDVGPYFGLRSATGAADRIRRSTDTLAAEVTNFSRLWTGSLSQNEAGPGAGVLISLPDGYYALRARPEPGSRLTAEARLTARAYLLAYPGASLAVVLADTGPNQSSQGAQTPLFSVDLDTAIPARTTTLAQAPSLTQIVVPGNLQSGADPVLPGMAVVIGATTLTDISAIASLQYAPGTDTTTITLTHPLARTPALGAAVRFGKCRIETVEHTHGPAQGANTWRGLEIRNAGDATDTPVVLFAFDAFNPDDGGFAIGPAGWSGNGYERQLEESLPGATERWMHAAAPDIWLAFIAHQSSATESLTDYTAAVRAAAPDAHIAWIGCVEFESTLHEAWHHYILDHARADGVVGETVLRHPSLGSFEDLAADGTFIDGAHLTARGNTAIANAALETLRAAARWPGDANNDARVDFADLNAILSNYGATGPNDGSLAGDVNLDGAVGFADLNAMLSNFGTSAFH